jgi:hypothetical protein
MTTSANSHEVEPGLLLSITGHTLRSALDRIAKPGTYLLAPPAPSAAPTGRPRSACLVFFADVTNAGFHFVFESGRASQVGSDLVLDLHRSSGLTWAELADVVAVDRRSLHLWARGARPSNDNQKRLHQVANLFHALDAGSPTATRERLMDSETGASVFDVLQHGSAAAKKPKPMRLTSRVTKGTFARERDGTSPTQRLGALHDAVRISGGTLRSVKPLRRRQG